MQRNLRVSAQMSKNDTHLSLFVTSLLHFAPDERILQAFCGHIGGCHTVPVPKTGVVSQLRH
jgi:hypothetical protein